MPIPRIIHQLWKDEAVPARYDHFRQSWRRRHPDWRFQLWTDADLFALVQAAYPALLGLYEGYQRNICRADLGRYLVLRSFGGIYADLDCECLRPIERLIDGAEFVIGREPDAHVASPTWAGRGLTQILCPSFIGSAPGHPFWDAVIGETHRS